MPIPKPFPPRYKCDYKINDANPGIQLFGRRFFIDQTPLEYLAEFLLVCHSPKNIEFECHSQENKQDNHKFSSLLPPWDLLQEWEEKELKYMPPVRLALKLFSFLGVSKLETRHPSHIEQYSVIIEKLTDNIHTDGSVTKKDVLQTLENLFLGFQGVGLKRTWCAQTFLPISNSLLIGETIWNAKKAKALNSELSWDQVVSQFKTYFSVSRHRFMARGGELLYLQICNAFRVKERDNDFEAFVKNFAFERKEQDPYSLYQSLEENLRRITDQVPPALDEIAVLIDEIDGITSKKTNVSGDNSVSCGWCPEESWREGYLFAVELNRVCSAAIDPVERIELLMVGCCLQVLRSLCAQSVRYTALPKDIKARGGSLGYAWIVSDLSGTDRNLKLLSQRNLQVIQRVIQQALRDKDIQSNVEKNAKKSRETLYNEADTRYGHKLFISLAKKLGFVVPQKGPGARFVFNDKIVKYMVLALVPPGKRVTYDDFKSSLYAHYGIALDGKELENAIIWSDLPHLSSSGVDGSLWLVHMLKASGFLIHLSDACSLVYNPYITTSSKS